MLFDCVMNHLLGAGRPTEIPEKDMYLNEARYDDEEGQFRKLKGLKVHCVVPENIQTPTTEGYFVWTPTPSEFPFQRVFDEPPYPLEFP